MKKLPYILLSLSAILYALPFFFSAYLWWLIFIFPIPLLYGACMHHFSFKYWYLWGIIVFLLHLRAGIFIVAHLAGNWWWIGFVMGMVMVLYQALMPAFLFWGTNLLIIFFSIQSCAMRIALYAIALGLFIFWTDQYSMWIFGICEGYPLMHPLIVLTHYPVLLSAMSILGKQILLIFFLAVPVSITIVLLYKNYVSLLLCASMVAPWLLCGLVQFTHEEKKTAWYTHIKSLPCMICARNSTSVMHILVRHLKKLLAEYPQTTIVVMPESALDMVDEKDMCLLSEHYIGKPLHIIFGACYCHDGCYYNGLYWIHDGVLKARFNKKHAMLITERLSEWMDGDWMRKMYCKNGISITQSNNKRSLLDITQDYQCIPYICSELFFNEYPDDDCLDDVPIIAIINDTLLAGTYLQELLLLLARLRAMQWQRDIVYVAYGTSVFIDKQGMVNVINT